MHQINMYQIKILNLKQDGTYAFHEKHYGHIWSYCFRENMGVIWREDASTNADYPYIWSGRYLENTSSIEKDGIRYYAANIQGFIETATQEQVDIFNYMYGFFRGNPRRKHYDWSKCLVLWKDDFFRIANPEHMSKEDMLFLYLNIIATNCQDGVGTINGYAIAEYSDFVAVAQPEQIAAVNTDIERRKALPSIWAQINNRKKEPKRKPTTEYVHYPDALDKLPERPRLQLSVRFDDDEHGPEYIRVEIKRSPAQVY